MAVEFRELSGPDELARAAHLIDEVFGAQGGRATPADLLVGISCAGGLIGGALLDGTLIGVCLAIGGVAAPPGDGPPALYSHLAAVHPSARGRRIGTALKWFQRSWALDRGITTIRWTFDPLVRRNSVLNLNLLGATGVQYRENMYGMIADSLNAGQQTDRLVAHWQLDSPRTLQALQGRREPATETPPEIAAACLHPSSEGGPDLRPAPGESGARRIVGTPADVEGLLVKDPPAAREWRRAQRAALAPAMADGFIVTGITRTGWIVLEAL